MKILIVDDHSYNRDLLMFILEDEGHECLQAEDGKIACDMVEKDENISLVLMDINMPEMDGITATRKIKEKFEERFIPILFVTALDDSEMITRCLEAGGNDFVPKPINESVLLAKINAHTRSHTLYSNLRNANEQLNIYKQQIDREHAIVERVFSNLSKGVTTYCKNVKKYTSPMSLFDGDLVLSAPSPSGGVYLLVGDFTGHGLAAAIGSIPAAEIFYSHCARQASVSQIASELNHRLFALLPTNMFCCATILHLEHNGKAMSLWSGGMNDLLYTDPNSNEIGRITSKHMPLGILESEEFDNSPTLLELAPGRKFYIYTDGLNEANNVEGEEFGQERLESLITAGGNIIETVVDAVHQFHSGVDQQDDLSLVELSTEPVEHRSIDNDEVVDAGSDYHRAESFPWAFDMRLEKSDLKSTNVVEQVMGFVSSIKGIELHQDKIFIILSELYSNALEHGVLRLSSSLKDTADGFEEYYKLREKRLNEVEQEFIAIRLHYVRNSLLGHDDKNFCSMHPNQIKIEITDSGDGFDLQKVLASPEESDDGHGRGVHLLKTLCSDLDYSEGGRKVTAVYDLIRHV